MSRFYGSLEGGRGEATRQGTAKSGIEGHIRGWHVGARVYVSVDSEGRDKVTIYATSGSRHSKNDIQIAEFTETDFNNPGFSSVVTQTPDTSELLASLKALARYAVKGETRYQSTNPYMKPEIKQALQIIAKYQGITEYLDANLDS